ncbi:MAG: hypothetical protein L6R35_002583 [Caloplaca aegaea]|nr:MAG: hypothetical protein L6R35_002583 [Caloplaca aegaea]
MVPARGHHSTHPLTRHAARILGVDAVDAVTGFTFGGATTAAAAETGSGNGRIRGRGGRGRGKATITGAVIFGPHREAIAAVISALEAERQVAEAEARTRVVLGWWRRLALGLRIRERVRGYEVEGEMEMEVRERLEVEEKEKEKEEGVGGFLPEERGGGEVAVPTAFWRARKEGGRRVLLVDDDDDEDESEDMDVHMPSNNGDGQVESGPVPVTHATREGKRRRVASSDDDDDEEEAGGFLPDDGGSNAGGGGGGFILPDDDQEAGGFLVGKADHHDDSSFTTAKKDPTQVEEEKPLIAANSSARDKRGNMFPHSSSSPTAEKNGEAAEPIAAADEYTSVAEVKLVDHGEEDTSPLHDCPMEGEEAEEGKSDKKEAFELRTTMTDDELEEARILQQLYESGAMDAAGHVPPEKLLEQTLDDDDDGKEQVGDADEDEGAGLVGAEVDKDSTMPNEGYDDAETKVADPSSEEEDKGSLISEDPDDEDAEPDWLP